MISRLLLVGMVGVLGISLPDGADLGMKMTWARTGATVCAGRRETVTFEPIAVGDDATNRIADELNRQSEGMDLPMMATARVAAKAHPVSVATEDVVARMFAENRVWGEPAAEAPAPTGQPVARATEDVVAKLFAENQVWAQPMTEASRAKDEHTARATEDVVARMFAENQVWAEAVAPMASPAPKAQPSFEPIAVAEGDSSMADELNRAAEGLDLAREPEPTVGNALRLTRDAALAWMNVLARTTTTESHSR